MINRSSLRDPYDGRERCAMLDRHCFSQTLRDQTEGLMKGGKSRRFRQFSVEFPSLSGDKFP